MISEDLFAEWPAVGSKQPRARLVGGQPGSGKSRLIQDYRRLMQRPLEVRPVIINGDEFRPFHPDFERHIASELDMPETTGDFIGAITEAAIDEAIQRRIPVVIEGTFRTASVVTSTIQKLTDAEYEVGLTAIGLHEWWSRLAIAHRYLLGRRHSQGAWGRWSPRSYHDSAYEQMVPTLHQVAHSFTDLEIVVTRRDGTKLYPNQFTDLSLEAAIEQERTRSWTEDEFLDFVRQGHECLALIETDTGALPEVADALDELRIEVTNSLPSNPTGHALG